MGFKKTGDVSKDYVPLDANAQKDRRAGRDREEAELAKKQKLAGDLTKKAPKKL